MKKAIIFDLEGTLSNTNNRKHLSPDYKDIVNPKFEDFDEWNEALVGDGNYQDIITILINKSKDHKIFILTAKPKKYEDLVLNWLSEHIPNIDFNYSIFMREVSEKYLSSSEVKKRQIDQLIHNGFTIVEAYDDRYDVCEMYLNNGIKPYKCNQGYAEKFFLKDKSDNIDTNPNEILQKGAEFFKGRNEEYGSAYLQHGKIMLGHFPNGITLETENDFLMFHIFVLDTIKSTRIAERMANNANHIDSWHDKMVYSAMGESILTNKE